MKATAGIPYSPISKRELSERRCNTAQEAYEQIRIERTGEAVPELTWQTRDTILFAAGAIAAAVAMWILSNWQWTHKLI